MRTTGIWLLLGSFALGATHTGAAPRAMFRDVTDTAGVSYLQHVPQVGSNCVIPYACEPSRMSGSAAVADVEGDGDVDLFVTVLDGPDILFLNQGDGTFAPSTTSGLDTLLFHSSGSAFGDIDNDGDQDLYVSVIGPDGDPTNNRNYLYINDGSGTFTENAAARGAAVASLARHFCYSVAFGDYDLDGWLDLLTTEWNYTGDHARLLRNVGATSPGTFQDVTLSTGASMSGVFGFAASFTDFDVDGLPDLVIAADFGTSRIFRNTGGIFVDATAALGVGTDENGMGSTLGDFDGDGDLDWFVTSIWDPDQTCETSSCNWGYSGNRLYRNEGGELFTDATDVAGVRAGGWGWGTVFFDYDNDGDLDLAMTNGADFPGGSQEDAFQTDPMRMWENDGSGVMTEISADVGLTDTGSGKGLLVFDFDDDGDLDLFVVNNASTPKLWRNEGGNANDWLRVRAVGSSSNRDGIGSRVTLRAEASGPVQVREIGTSSHFMGQSERVAHFGLGAAGPTADEVVVRWPSGKIERYADVAVNSLLIADEGSCVDADLDDRCLGADCNDGSAAVYLDAPEINDGLDNQCPGDVGHGLTDETTGAGYFDPGNRDELCWDAQSGATGYEVRRATNPQLSGGCGGTTTADPCWDDPGAPPPGTTWFYLTRTISPNTGSWGADSNLVERAPGCS